MDEKRITKPVCSRCGSDEISCDATAAWNVETQAWELSGHFDLKICLDCSEEMRNVPFVVWEGDARGKWVADPAHPLRPAALARINDDDAVNPGFVDLSQTAEG